MYILIKGKTISLPIYSKALKTKKEKLDFKEVISFPIYVYI